jgi:hypothetical protein
MASPPSAQGEGYPFEDGLAYAVRSTIKPPNASR